MTSLPPGCHLIPEVVAPLAEQRDTFLQVLRLARGPCRAGIVERLQRVGEQLAAEAMRAGSEKRG